VANEREEDGYQRFWRLVPVVALPYPFHLFRCRFVDRHLEALAAVGASPDEFPTPAQCASAFSAFVRELSDEINDCPFHQPDWGLAAERAINATRQDGSDDLAQIRVDTSELDDETSWAAWSFFEEPIWLSGYRLGNGQHRTCAMKCARVAQAPGEEARPRQMSETD
jgi:hypothetical protein